MKKIFILFTTISIATFAADEVAMPEVYAPGDASNGSTLVATCAACHGGDGNSINTDWPNLAGQSEKYLLAQLNYFKDGERENALMMAVIPYLNSLSDKELKDIAAFYASGPPNIGRAKNDAELLALGESLYRSGDIKRGIPACTACHSVYGDGNNLAGFPSVAGQQYGYLKSTLVAYRSGERNNGDYATVMQAVAQNLTDNEIDALSNYMHGLYK